MASPIGSRLPSRRIRGLKAEAPPPPPPHATQDIEYRAREVPSSLLNKGVQAFFVEVLNAGDLALLNDDEENDPVLQNKIKNHVVIRVTFKREISEATPDAPAETKGVRISCDTDHTAAGASMDEMGAKFVVSTLRYDFASYSAVKVFSLVLVDKNITLRPLLRPAINLNMAEFFFVSNGRGFIGCRDRKRNTIHEQ
ncbi:hypothetical protein FQN51_005537 [Onygenales sp. PD_10]|nr:hypothetical protein FQN51_005537 [Onygenales sp. PD_10]